MRKNRVIILLALGCVASSLVACGDSTPAGNNNPAASVPPVTTTAAGQTALPTTGPAQPTSAALTTTASAENSAATPDNQATTAPSQATEPSSATAGQRATPAISAGIASGIGKGQTAVRALSTAGTVTAYDQQTGLINLNTPGGKPVVVKLTSKTVVISQGEPVESSLIKVGDKLTASGVVNSDGQFEATTVALGVIRIPAPVGEPGYPDGKK
ncbi:MAG TPA: hypothetical protein VH186_15345 [Chloroflexia bacterium]|nr:hypothetical protein [Chloroflexia bacterium]